MQVSWIEADDLKDLLARISPAEPAAPPPAARPWDIMSMPAVEPPSAASFIITADEPFVAAEPPDDPAPVPVQEPAAMAKAAPPPAPAVPAVPAAPAAPEAAPALPLVKPEPAVQPLEPEPTTAQVTPNAEDHSDHSAAALPLSRIRDKLRAIRQRANDAGMLAKAGTNAALPPPPAEKPETLPAATAAPPAPTVSAPAKASPSKPPSAAGLPRFDTPTGGREERLAAFARWARQILYENGGHLLVMNDEGELLWGGEAKAGLVLSAMMAWGATLRGSATAAYGSLPVLHQALASGHMLTAIPCETFTGILLHVAVVGPESLPDDVAMQLRQGLIRAAGTQFD